MRRHVRRACSSAHGRLPVFPVFALHPRHGNCSGRSVCLRATDGHNSLAIPRFARARDNRRLRALSAGAAQESFRMKPLLRRAAALLIAIASLPAANVHAQDKQVLASERDKDSYMIGMDVAKSLAPAAEDLDLAAFERAVRNAFDGGDPLIEEKEADRKSTRLNSSH